LSLYWRASSEFFKVQKLVSMSAWQKAEGSRVTRIVFLASFRWPKCAGSLVLRRRESDAFVGAENKSYRPFREVPGGVLLARTPLRLQGAQPQ
jgi:hypothetical protein